MFLLSSFVVLKAFDMNGDGRVDETELRHILQSAYPSITDLNVNCLFNQVDVKHRGAVTYGKCRIKSFCSCSVCYGFT